MPNELMAKYYGQRAGADLIISEATVISTQAIGWNQTPGIYTDAQAEAWSKIVNCVHEKGTPMFLQLWQREGWEISTQAQYFGVVNGGPISYKPFPKMLVIPLRDVHVPI